MRKILTIDHGNSSVKVNVYEGSGDVTSLRMEELCIEAVAELVERVRPDGIVYAAVGKTDARMLESVSRLDGNVLVVTHATPLPIGIAYGTPGTLGLDRVAAAVAAAAMFPDETLLVADAGTALTADIVSADGVFMGGNISAGVRLRLDSLASHTAQLPRVLPEGRLPIYGKDTETALRCGAVRGAAAEIAYTAAAGQCSRIVLTGGDAALVANALCQMTSMPLDTVDDLVGKGLLRIYEHNEDN
ncbi:MAG TPA: type III pantothenate kinase [Porphyromonadaceae bacterium]|nr:type III pantothenate kinase [Porphyromonadaceae bacterium]